jgi:uncharacterized protein
MSKINRREFIAYAGTITAGFAAGFNIVSGKNTEAAEAKYKNVIKELMKYRKIDSHNHAVMLGIEPENLIESMDRLGIERASVSDIDGLTPDKFSESNSKILDVVKKFPNRFLGQCHINPRFQKESLAEIDRCVGSGMVQLGELYSECKINDPLYYPIIEKCIDLKIPLMMHARADLGLIRKGYRSSAPLTSSYADDFVDIGRRYPEAIIIHAHIGGGGDWEYMCKTLRPAKSIYIDTSGSVTDEGMIEFAIKYLGEDRMLFATDVNFECGVGKIMAANITESQRRKIFFENYNNLLRKAGNNVN